jgi:hypothetical protein
LALQILTATFISSEKEKKCQLIILKKNYWGFIQRTDVAIVSTYKPSRYWCFKRAIESNAQRKVTIINPNKLTS